MHLPEARFETKLREVEQVVRRGALGRPQQRPLYDVTQAFALYLTESFGGLRVGHLVVKARNRAALVVRLEPS